VAAEVVQVLVVAQVVAQVTALPAALVTLLAVKQRAGTAVKRAGIVEADLHARIV